MLFAAGNNELRFSRLQCVLNTTEGRKESSLAIASPRQGAVEKLDTLPPECWAPLSRSSLTALGEMCCPTNVGGQCDALWRLGRSGNIDQHSKKSTCCIGSMRWRFSAGRGMMGLQIEAHHQVGY